MSAIRDWLKSIGLEQYAEAFERADIGFDVLPDLSESDLAELGVSLGNRRRLLKVIAERPPEAPDAAAAAAEPSGEAERRQLTVMFSDLVGSTALSAQLDPEVMAALIRRYQETVAAAIARFDGFVAKFMGDGVLAYFGFPHAYEDAAERAARAALAIVADVAQLPGPGGKPLSARLGIATGLVVVGEIVGTGTAREHSIAGETPNLAARLQALAAPGEIMVSEATLHLLGALFEVESAGSHGLKGFPEPVPAWRLFRESSLESRFAAIRAGAVAPLIGRAHEMALLLERWRLAQTGEGQIVTIIGEAGIGKSRSIEALQDSLGDAPRARIYLQCSPYHRDSALYPVIQCLAREAGIAPDDGAAAKLDKLAALFPGAPESRALLADLMSLAVEGVAPPAGTPQQRRAATIAMLVDRLARLSETRPVIFMFEDAHWSDATTLEFTTRLADNIGQARVLAIATGRPEFQAPWLARPNASLLTLGRLGRAECAQLVAGVATAHGLSPETVAAIVAKTDGVPLFVEELTKSVMETAGDGGAAVPSTLKDSLMARLDRLGEAREVAQIASVIGRQFRFALLDAVAPKGADLEASLMKLVAAGIVFPEGSGVERGFLFKHALMRDATYENLLIGRRRDWHGRIARALEEHFPDLAANEPELLAHHFAEAGLLAEACDYRRRAGERAVARSAFPEAIAHFNAGLQSAGLLSDPRERSRRQLEFLLKLGPAQMTAFGMQSAEVTATYERAAEIGAALDDQPGLYKAKWGLWLNANIGRKTGLAKARAAELVALAQQAGDENHLFEAYHCRWATAFFRGDVAPTLADAANGMAIYDRGRHHHLAVEFGGHDGGVCALMVQSVAYQTAADTERATENHLRGVALAEALDHPASLAYALTNTALCSQMIGDRNAIVAQSGRLGTLVEKYGLVLWRSGGRIMDAWANAVGSGVHGSVRIVEAEIERAIAQTPLALYLTGLCADIMIAAGRPSEGIALIERGLAGVDEPGVGFFLPEIYRLRGRCLLALDRTNRDAARRDFEQAIAIAENQGAARFHKSARDDMAAL